MGKHYERWMRIFSSLSLTSPFSHCSTLLTFSPHFIHYAPLIYAAIIHIHPYFIRIIKPCWPADSLHGGNVPFSIIPICVHCKNFKEYIILEISFQTNPIRRHTWKHKSCFQLFSYELKSFAPQSHKAPAVCIQHSTLPSKTPIVLSDVKYREKEFFSNHYHTHLERHNVYYGINIWTWGIRLNSWIICRIELSISLKIVT